MYDCVISGIINNPMEELLFFPVDNKARVGISNLRLIIEQVVHQDKSMSEEVSMKWMLFLDQIILSRQENDYISLRTVKHLATLAGINDQEVCIYICDKCEYKR